MNRDSSPDVVTFERHDAVGVVTLDRPKKLNALSTHLERSLSSVLKRNDVASCKALVFTGAGGNFSAGADTSEMSGLDVAAALSYYRQTGGVYEEVAALAQPSVSAISGYCLGGGLELALATDLRVADEKAVFGLPEVAIGIVPSSGGILRLVRAVGTARAKELVIGRSRFSAADAHRFGLVTEVVATGEALSRALELAGRLAELPSLAVTLARRAIDAAAESSRDAALLIEQLSYAALVETNDSRQHLGTRNER